MIKILSCYLHKMLEIKKIEQSPKKTDPTDVF